MTDLLGAVDETNDGEYLAFLIGDPDAVAKNLRLLPRGFRHMSNQGYTNIERRNIINNLDLTGNLLACCIKFDIPTIKEYITSYAPFKVSNRRYYQRVSYRMKSALNSIYNPFLMKHRKTLQEIEFQADSDTTKAFLRPSGLQCIEASDIHKIADCIAYANLKKWDLRSPNVIEKGDDFGFSFFDSIRDDLDFYKGRRKDHT